MGHKYDKVDLHLAEALQKRSNSEFTTKTDIETILNGIKGSEPNIVLECIKTIRHLFSAPNIPDGTLIESIVKKGLIPICLSFLNPLYNTPEFQYETTCLLLNISTGNDDQTNAIIDNGGIYLIINLMDSDNEKIKEVSVWTLANLACDGVRPRDLMISVNIIPKIIQILVDPNSSLKLLEITTWLCANLCYPIYYNSPAYNHTKPLLSPLINLLDKDNVKLVKSCARAIRYILRSLRSISDALNLELLEKLRFMFRSADNKIVLQGAFILGTVSRGSMENNEQIFENNQLMTDVLDILNSSDDFSCLREITLAIFKLLSRVNSHIVQNFVTSTRIYEILINLSVWRYDSLNNVVDLTLSLLRDHSGVTYLEHEE